ncbi:MAG: hypothetical protein LBG52_02755 [Candidatus Peribacteria bacterium]|jgi:hypothetical protein|nr:hypothetical protein [Candidatus Peribacteria bacterium]
MPTLNKKSSLPTKKTAKNAETKKSVKKSVSKPARTPAITKKPVLKKTTKSLSDQKEMLSQKAAFIKKMATQAETQLQPTKRSKETQKIPLRVRVFFGASLLLFCIAFYQAILRPMLNFTPANAPTNIPEIIVSDNENEWIASQLTPDPLPPTSTLQTSGEQFLQQFYQTMSQKDIATLTTLFDAPLQKSTEIKQFFSAYKITPFIENITHNRILPEQIELLATSPSGVEEYRYQLNYHLDPTNQDFAETRVTKVRYTET